MKTRYQLLEADGTWAIRKKTFFGYRFYNFTWRTDGDPHWGIVSSWTTFDLAKKCLLQLEAMVRE